MQRHVVRFVLRVPPQNSSLRAGLRPFIILKILARTILNGVQNSVQVKMVFDICIQYKKNRYTSHVACHVDTFALNHWCAFDCLVWFCLSSFEHHIDNRLILCELMTF